MTEPILSREEVEALAHRICARYVHNENIHLRQYTFGITTLEQLVSAVIDNALGEPMATIQHSDMVGKWLMWDQNLLELPTGTKLFALTRSKP